ncbi:MAG: ComEA family DNA-binding protein [Acholeplasmatales bacterium]|nr:MAG: ComEA family DNA-binding protein [Acholeplasmatales bacterium]
MANLPKWGVYLSVAIIIFAALALNILRRPSAVATLPVFMEEARDLAPAHATIYIDLKGAVQMPGVYKVPADMRLFQVIRLAGGLCVDADVSRINMSAQLFDQQAITIPFVQNTSEEQGNAHDDASDAPLKISLSQADAATLVTLPGIGPATAERIVADRLVNGPFERVEDIMRVSGIGPAIYEGIKPFVTP